MSLQEEIKMCLNCTKPVCDNCIDGLLNETNKKRNKLHYIGEEGRSLSEWAKLLKIPYATLSRRIRTGMKLDTMPEAKEYVRCGKSTAA